MNKFAFNPPTGLLDEAAFPTNPATQQEARGQVQTPMNQLRDFINDKVKPTIDELESFKKGFDDISKSSSGYAKLPNGLTIQWVETDIDVPVGDVGVNNVELPIPLTGNNIIISKNTEIMCRVENGWGYENYIERVICTSFIQLDGVEKTSVYIKLCDINSKLPKTTKFKVKFCCIYY